MSDSQLDLVSSFDGAWARFQQRDSLLLAGDTVEQEWSRGRAQYLTFIVRIEDTAARQTLARTGERLRGILGVELYPDWYWHVTVKGVGFQVIKRTHDDDVSRDDVPRIAGAARGVLAREHAYEGQLGPANGFAGVVFIELSDSGRTRELNVRLSEGIPRVLRYPGDGDRFLPHISIARFTSNEGLDQLKAALAELRREGPGPALPIRRVDFIKAWLVGDEPPEFDTLATYQLASPLRGGRPA